MIILMNPKWQVIYYISLSGNNPIDDFLDGLSENQQSKLIRIFHYIKEYGLQSVIPHVKKLSGTPFWEIRILGRDNIRTIYAVPEQKQVLILHGFVKKSPKTPTKEIGIALNRFTEYQNRAIDK